jgi:hypothetical protein
LSRILVPCLVLAAWPAHSEETDVPLKLHFSRTRIKLDDDRRFIATSTTIARDSVSFFREVLGSDMGYQPADAQEEHFRIVPLRSVKQVEVPSGNHAALGAGIGALIGVGLWGVVSNAAGDAWSGGGYSMFILVIPGAFVGALSGGATEDWETVYDRR